MTTGGGHGSTLHTVYSHNGTQLELKRGAMRTILIAETGKEKGKRQGTDEKTEKRRQR